MRAVASADGFSLVESLIACLVLATAVLSIAHITSGAVTMIADARRTTVATLLASSKLEELRTSSAPVSGSDVVGDPGQPLSSASARRYERRWTVTSVSGDVSLVNVVVTSDGRGPAGGLIRMTGSWTRVAW